MAFRKSLQAIVLGLAMYGSSSGISNATENITDELRINHGDYQISSPELKKEEFARKPFFFDEIHFAPIGKIYLDNKLKNFATNHASFKATLFTFPLPFMAPTRLLGLEDWWPEKLAWTWSIGNEAYAKDKGVQQVVWNLSTDLRWYFNPESFAGFGWQHHSFAGMSCECSETFIQKNSINVSDVNVRDILFLRFAHQFKGLDDKISTEYFITKNLWEAYLGDVLSAEEKKHRPYDFPEAFAGKTSFDIGNSMDFSVGLQGEYSEKSIPRTYEFAINLFSSDKKEKGASIFYKKTSGVGENKIRVGFHGLEMDGTLMGIRMFHDSF
ncbi:MAG: hypothetical protein AABX93_00870 [Nanoarchaeota archaeon]